MENIERLMRLAMKDHNATRYFYYLECRNSKLPACQSFDKFKGSWAYEGWLRRNQPDITEFVLKQNRHSIIKWRIE